MPMSRGAKVFRPTDLPESNASGYPAPFRDSQRKRWNRRLGDHGGLKNYGVNFVRVEPGGLSSARHSYTKLRLPRIGGHLAKLQRERKGVEWATDDVILPMSS